MGDEGQGDSAEAAEGIGHEHHGDRAAGGEERRRTSRHEAVVAAQTGANEEGKRKARAAPRGKEIEQNATDATRAT